MGMPEQEPSGCLPVDQIAETLAHAQPLVLYDLMAVLCSTLVARRLICQETYMAVRELMQASDLHSVIPEEVLVMRAKESDEAIARGKRRLGRDAQGQA